MMEVYDKEGVCSVAEYGCPPIGFWADYRLFSARMEEQLVNQASVSCQRACC